MWMYWFTALLDDIESESKEDLPAVDEEVTEPAAAAASPQWVTLYDLYGLF